MARQPPATGISSVPPRQVLRPDSPSGECCGIFSGCDDGGRPVPSSSEQPHGQSIASALRNAFRLVLAAAAKAASDSIQAPCPRECPRVSRWSSVVHSSAPLGCAPCESLPLASWRELALRNSLPRLRAAPSCWWAVSRSLGRTGREWHGPRRRNRSSVHKGGSC